MSEKPTSRKRQAANRANAARSTGPRTPEGKARSSQNARKHGFNSSSFAVVRLEELDVLQNLRARAVEEYRPVNSQELFAVDRIALAQLSLYRCGILEAGLHTAAMNETMSPGGVPANLLQETLTFDLTVVQSQNRALCLAEGFTRLVGKSDVWKLFLRYQAQSERMFRRALEDFNRLKALRHEMPNEPIQAADLAPATPPDQLMPPPANSTQRIFAALDDATVSLAPRPPLGPPPSRPPNQPESHSQS